MAVVRYSAQRSLQAGVNVNDIVTLDLQLRYAGGLQRGRANVGHRRVTQAGYRETWYVRGEVTWQLATIPVATAAQAAMRQFLDSVEDGRTFEFAPEQDSGDSPIDWRNVVAEGDYTEVPESARADLSSFAFAFVEVP